MGVVYTKRGQLPEYKGFTDKYHVLLGRDILDTGIFQIHFGGQGLIGF